MQRAVGQQLGPGVVDEATVPVRAERPKAEPASKWRACQRCGRMLEIRAETSRRPGGSTASFSVAALSMWSAPQYTSPGGGAVTRGNGRSEGGSGRGLPEQAGVSIQLERVVGVDLRAE